MPPINFKSTRGHAWAIIRRMPSNVFVEIDELVNESIAAQLRGRQSVSGPMQDFLRRRPGYCQNQSALVAPHVPLDPRMPAPVTPESQYERTELPVPVRRRLAQLPERTRTILYGLYWEGRTQLELAKQLGVSDSRISQIELAALRLLREAA